MTHALRLVLAVLALAVTAAVLVLVSTLGGGDTDTGFAAELGDPRAGKAVIERTGCTSCHEIAGIVAPEGRVGPSLVDFAEARDIAGRYPNNADVLVRWLRNPQALEPGTIMPNLGLTEREARNVAAYLYSDP